MTVFESMNVRGIRFVFQTTTLSRSRRTSHRVTARAPLGVQATLASSWDAVQGSFEASNERLQPLIESLMATKDAAEGVRSFVERREASFKGA